MQLNLALSHGLLSMACIYMVPETITTMMKERVTLKYRYTSPGPRF